MEPNRPSSSSSSQSRTSRDLHCWDPCSFYIYCSSVTAMSHISPSPECWPISGSPHLFKNSSSQFSYPWRCSVPWFGYRRMLKPRFPIWGSPLMGHAHPAELERKCAKVAWPSGLRRWFKAPVSSEAWVRIPPPPKMASNAVFHPYHLAKLAETRWSPKLYIYSKTSWVSRRCPGIFI